MNKMLSITEVRNSIYLDFNLLWKLFLGVYLGVFIYIKNILYIKNIGLSCLFNRVRLHQ